MHSHNTGTGPGSGSDYDTDSAAVIEHGESSTASLNVAKTGASSGAEYYYYNLETGEPVVDTIHCPSSHL